MARRKVKKSAAEFVKELRLSKKMNQRSFADAVGLNQSTICLVEGGHLPLGRRLAAALQKKFKIDSGKLFELMG